MIQTRHQLLAFNRGVYKVCKGNRSHRSDLRPATGPTQRPRSSHTASTQDARSSHTAVATEAAEQPRQQQQRQHHCHHHCHHPCCCLCWQYHLRRHYLCHEELLGGKGSNDDGMMLMTTTTVSVMIMAMKLAIRITVAKATTVMMIMMTMTTTLVLMNMRRDDDGCTLCDVGNLHPVLNCRCWHWYLLF